MARKTSTQRRNCYSDEMLCSPRARCGLDSVHAQVQRDSVEKLANRFPVCRLFAHIRGAFLSQLTTQTGKMRLPSRCHLDLHTIESSDAPLSIIGTALDKPCQE